VGSGLFGSQPFGFLQAVQRFAGLPSHGVGLREVDEVAGLPFGRQPFGVEPRARSRACPASPSSTATDTACSATLVGPNSVPKSLRSSARLSAISWA
jgi:hypothetical protein